MRVPLSLLAAALILSASPGAARAAEPSGPNTLTAKEQADGWKLLFDGKSTAGWRRYKGKSPGDKWQVLGGALVFKPKDGKVGGDIITTDQFESFELAIDWKVTPGANSGVMYRVAEDEPAAYMTGPEYQILDNARHRDGKNPKTSAASCYALYAPVKDLTKPVGEWNHGRIVVNGDRVEHWLNGTKVVTFAFGNDDWSRLVSGSKFNEWKRFGTVKRGHIDLQDHGDEVAFRNIKVKVLGGK